jgi:hypothetical protein
MYVGSLIFQIKESYSNQIGYEFDYCRFIGVTDEDLSSC